jgi:glycosyltransferase involved in cell wall biosynthesis
MKIGHVLNEFSMPGGETTVSRQIADGLGAVRFERSSKEWMDGRPAGRLTQAAKSFYNWEVAREFRQWAAREKPDVILFHNIFPVLSPGIVEEAANLGIRTIVYLHSYRYLCTNGFFLNHGELCERCIGGDFWAAPLTACWRDSRVLSGWYGAILSTLRPRGFFERVDRFVSVSEFVRRKYIEAGISAEKITALHNFFDLRGISPSSRDDGYVLFVGRMSAEKGVLTLLDAAALLPDVPFRLAGDGPLFAEAYGAAKRRGLTNVSFLGFVDGAAKSDLYAGARLVVVPSEWNEPFPTVVPEAYAHAKPVLASRMGGLVEMIESGKTGDFFLRRHAHNLAEQIRWIFDDPARAGQWGRNGRHWVETHCDPEAWDRRMREILEELVRA